MSPGQTLVPAIHVFLSSRESKQDVYARAKRGHDEQIQAVIAGLDPAIHLLRKNSSCEE
jgi:hypothetical protein